MERTRSFFASIPNDLENKTEKHYQTIFYLLFRLMGMYVDSEVKSAVGRADVVIKMQDAIYVLEFKYDGTAGGIGADKQQAVCCSLSQGWQAHREGGD